MHWPFNYPGDNYLTNVFSQIIVLADEIKESAIELIEDISEKVMEETK